MINLNVKFLDDDYIASAVDSVLKQNSLTSIPMTSVETSAPITVKCIKHYHHKSVIPRKSPKKKKPNIN